MSYRRKVKAMIVQSITLWRVTLPMKFDFQTAKGLVRERHTLVVDVETANGTHGYGEVVAFDTPFYTAETITTSEEWLNQVIPYFVGIEMKEPWDCYKVFEDLTSTFPTPQTPQASTSPTQPTPPTLTPPTSTSPTPISRASQAPQTLTTSLTSLNAAPMAWAGLENALLHAYFEEAGLPMIQTLLEQELQAEGPKGREAGVCGTCVSKIGVREIAVGETGVCEASSCKVDVCEEVSLNDEIPIGLVFGDMPIPNLLQRIDDAVQKGCKRVKIKLTPRDAVERLQAVREVYPDLILAADANRSFDVNDWPQVAQLDRFNLRTIEEPFSLIDDDLVKTYSTLPQDFWKDWHTSITFDESIQSLEALQAMERWCIAMETMQVTEAIQATETIQVTETIQATETSQAIEAKHQRFQPVLNIKIGRLGGLRETLRCLAYCRAHKWGFWIGSMVESGISKILHVQLAALPDVWMAGDLSDSKRYFEEDLISPDILFVDGRMKVPRGSGLGVTVRRDCLQTYGEILKEFV